MEQNSSLLEREVLDRLVRIETKLDDYKEIKQDATQALNLSKNNKEEINEINDKIKWLSRTISASLITGAVGIIFLFIKIGIGVN